jgi:hypothetical protein
LKALSSRSSASLIRVTFADQRVAWLRDLRDVAARFFLAAMAAPATLD